MTRPVAQICALLLTLLIAACGGGGGGASSMVIVPTMTGLDISNAITDIVAAGLTENDSDSQFSTTVPINIVISQSPAAGTSVARGTTVTLIVSNGPAAIVPNVIGDTQAAATAASAEANLQLYVSSSQFSSTVPAGIIISQTPAAGTSVILHAAIGVVLSQGAPIAVPNVVGDTQAAAGAAITAADLVEGTVTMAFSATVPVGSVISQTPAPGTDVLSATPVNLVVSSYLPVAVPNVVGDTQALASTAITAAGLVVGGVTPLFSTTVPVGDIVSQSPAAGTGVQSGTAVNVAVSSSSQATESILHSFSGCASSLNCNSYPADGANPAAGLIKGSDGNFYGTTSYGGSLNQGTVFQISPAGVEAILHTFSGYGAVSGSADGAVPVAPLILGSDGNFYGSTTHGGAYSAGGTVFRISASGAETVLYSFSGCDDPEPCGIQGSADGANPDWLIQGSDGNFYGTTLAGGTNEYGTVFRLTLGGAETVLHSFYTGSPGNRDGLTPNGLIQGSDGNYYGTTSNGGMGGTVFKITPAGAESVLYAFSNSVADGGVPNGNLIQASDGNFYGTTSGGGAYNGGNIFKLTPSGVETVLYSFVNVSGSFDGNSPSGALMQGSDGNFYGTTTAGGVYGQGTVFRVTTGGAEAVLYSFSGCYFNDPDGGPICGISGSKDGAGPVGGLIQDNAGNLYGATFNGGTDFAGTLFKLTGVIAGP